MTEQLPRAGLRHRALRDPHCCGHRSASSTALVREKLHHCCLGCAMLLHEEMLLPTDLGSVLRQGPEK